MRILIFHGYLLKGTGSNIYNASLAQALSKLGHDVELLCQERDPGTLGEPHGPGSITIHNPDIGGLLPVFVRDEYEGFRVKLFSELTEAELERFVAANVSAVSDVAAAGGGVDAALANHLVMGPLILAHAQLQSGYAIAVHGSDIEYTVQPDPRFVPHAREGALGANGILVGSRHIAERLWETVDDRETRDKTRLGPPGVDVELFARVGPEEAAEGLRRLGVELEADGGGDAFGRTPAAATAALREFAGATGPRVLYVGKLIPQKGVDWLLRAWPTVEAANPGARLLIVGFGDQQSQLMEMADGRVSFTGRLEHEEVARVMRVTDALVFPSVFPEAFGMVAAEAAATGVLPVCADHSGLHEVAAALASRLPPEAAGLVAFPLGDDAAEAIAERLNSWLALDSEIREQCRDALAATVRELWSWETVAEGVIAASQGRLDGLPRIPED